MAKLSTLDVFLDGCAAVRRTGAGTRETSFYPALRDAFDAVGDGLKPKVFALHHTRGGAAGIPDFGFFERRKRGTPPPDWQAGIMPERGVAEVKGLGQRIDALVADEQVARYRARYGLVLATNLRQFRLLDGAGAVLERFDLAADEAGFWALAHGSRTDTLRTRFADFLQRCLLTRAPLAKPADLAFFLASYARDALAALTDRADLPALRALRENLEKGLGIAFDQRDGEHLFRSTLVQTLFYGLFSAWVAHVQEKPGEAFAWRQADWSLHVPVMQLLFQQVASPQALQPLGIAPLLDAAQAALARIDRAAFFTAFEDASAIQHFYEPFLEFFDPALRKQLGVWYTPPEIVRYMVERVDRVLRSELGVADGLADESVWVLDPCCGTGSYLVEVLRRIRETLAARGLGDLLGEALRRAATTRVVGFEIMPAPFVIAHWQVGEALRAVQAPLRGGERAAVYLTNALTGWDPAEKTGSLEGAFAALAQEREEARAVKQARPILVVIGNPPYNAFAGTSPESEGGLVEPYKTGLNTIWGVRKFNLDDLYVRFFRIAERRIAEITGRGIVSFITNYSWLSSASFVVMRQSILRTFDRAWIENLHGDRKITEYGPDGKTSETIFAVDGFSAGIKQGVAIATLVKAENRPRIFLFRDDINASSSGTRRAQLLSALGSEGMVFDAAYVGLSPNSANRFSLRPGAAGEDYTAWAPLADLSVSAAWSGLLEKRKGALISHDKAELEARISRYADAAVPFAILGSTRTGPVDDAARFDASAARERLLAAGGTKAGSIRRIALLPFDTRWCFYSDIRPLWNEPRPEVGAQQAAGARFLIVRGGFRRNPVGFPSLTVTALPGDYLLDPNCHPLPDALYPIDAGHLAPASGPPRPNLSPAALAWTTSLGLPPDADTSRLVWHHALAVTYSPAYLAENAEGIRQGWPRIPLPDDAALLRTSAALGARLALLLDSDTPVPGVTEGRIAPALASIAVPSTRDGAARDWHLTGWGHRTDKGVTMPGRGQSTARPYAAGEDAAEAEATLLGATTLDVHMNGASYWRNVPEKVWETHIGGYQVIKKWLSYRDRSILDRALSAEEVAHVPSVARRLAAILLMGPALDASFRACAAAHVPLRKGGVEGPGN